jgi:exodeoxyribonuclease VII large subunit
MSERINKNVSQIVGEIKNLLETEFINVSIEGEISNLSLSSSGHWYFTLSDSESSISGAIFKMDALRNPQLKLIKDGAKVIVAGDINVYQRRGTFQIVAKKIVALGLGDLKEQFEKLKKKLAEEGLFDLDQKKKIPEFPKRVAIITAQRGAALQDFVNIYKRRSLWMDLLVFPAIVQGKDAPESIRHALHNLIKYSLAAPAEKKIDVIVLARGGGSLEDLWAFNDEGLAWDLYNCPIPTISAIGHEVDFSISDYVCDLRAETPSAAAEILTHQQTMIKDKMNSQKSRLLNVMNLKYMTLERKLKNFQLDNRLNELTHIHDYYLRLDDNLEQMKRRIDLRIERNGMLLDRYSSVMSALNPNRVLERGYTYVEAESGAVISSKKDFCKLDSTTKLKLHFSDGNGTVVKAHEK